MVMTIEEFLSARLDEMESGVRAALRTEDYGVSEFDLDDIAAKRRIIEWCAEREKVYIGGLSSDPDNPRPEDFIDGGPAHPEGHIVLRLLALPYADHPDYQDEWTP